MTQVMQFDEKRLRELEITYQSPDVVAQRRRLLEEIRPLHGEKALEVGCGPGFVAEELARAVGPDGQVCAIDNSEGAILLGRQKCKDHPQAKFEVADATKLPYDDGEFDLATITQVYEYVPEIDQALRELHRVLRPGGRAAIIDTDWHTVLWHTNHPERMRRVLKAWDEHLAHPTLPRTLRARLHDAGLTLRKCIAVPYLDMEYKPDSYSHNMSKTVRAFIRERQGITAEEANEWVYEFRQLAQEGAYFFCLNRYLFLAEKL
jgi:arsenite methyltransferase